MITRKKLADSLRFLSIDAIQKAKSGHPGMPMGMADIAEVLWNDFLQHDPTDPKWPNRDRFILSNGHGSMLLYALLHLSGYALSIDDLKQFRQLYSITPGHPEYNITPGVEITTGPLGQGLASAVGMALAEQLLANRFNRATHQIINHYTYCFVGDGCLMEGVTHEACSFAGTLGLGKLIVFWDNNGVSLDGPIGDCCKEDIARRFLAYGWQVITDVNGHEAEEIKQAIIAAKRIIDKPTLICCHTTIGYGSPTFAGSAKCHGIPLGEAEVELTRAKLGWEFPAFVIPPEFYSEWDAKEKGKQATTAWQNIFSDYQQRYPALAQEFTQRLHGELPRDWCSKWEQFIKDVQQKMPNVATRESSRNVLDFVGEFLPGFIGGAADLSSSVFTKNKNVDIIETGKLNGNYINYGVREFAMVCVMNGLSLHGGFIPYGGTFLIFSDYARPAIRLAALMKLQAIYVLTHDSIAVGEDGPTHQPIEQLATLRIMPNVSLWRPADAVETAIAWQIAIENKKGPTVLALTRQPVSCQARTIMQVEHIKLGGYVLIDCEKKAQVILIATGSEVELAVQAAAIASKNGYLIRVVSMPSVDTFLAQKEEYRYKVLPAELPKIVIEAGTTAYWHQLVQGNGKILGIDCYGNSAPGAELYKHFNLTVENIVSAIEEVL
jgi:transketolase